MNLKRITSAIIFVPLAIIVLAFMIANRGLATLTFNPFDNSKWQFTLPFFIWLFLFLIIGMILGALIVWLGQHKYRKALRDCENQLQRAQNDQTKIQ